MIQKEAWFRSGGVEDEVQRLIQELGRNPSNTDALQQLMRMGDRVEFEIPPEVLEPAMRAWIERVKALPTTPQNLQAFKDILRLPWPFSRYLEHGEELEFRNRIRAIVQSGYPPKGPAKDQLGKVWAEALDQGMLPPIPWTLAKSRSPSVVVEFTVPMEVYAVVDRHGNSERVYVGEGQVAPGGKRNTGDRESPSNRWRVSLPSFFRWLHRSGFYRNDDGGFERLIERPVNGRLRLNDAFLYDWTRAHPLQEYWNVYFESFVVDGKRYPGSYSEDPQLKRWFEESAG